MEKHKGYMPQSEGAEMIALRDLLRRRRRRDIPIVVFPSKGKPFAALIGGFKPTSQYGNPSVQLWTTEGEQTIFAGGTTTCKLEDLKKFPRLEKKINAHIPEYRPKSYRYTKEAEARFFKKKFGSHSPPSSAEN